MRLFLICLLISYSFAQEVEEEEEEYEDNNEEVSNDLIDLSSLQNFLNQISNTSSSSVNSTLLEDLLFLQSLSSRATEVVIQTIFPLLSDSIQRSNISSQCFQTLLQILQALRRQEDWPLRYVDSSARFPFSGLLEGRISDFGEYRECLRFKTGKYCLTSISLRLPSKPNNLLFHENLISVEETPLKGTLFETVADNANLFYIAKGIRLGVCVPNSCSKDDIKQLSEGLISALRLRLEIPEECETGEDVIEWTLHQKVSIFVISFLTLLSIGASFAPKERPFLRCFSLKETTRRLFLSDTRSKRLATIHGLRVIAILWIFIGHIYLMQFFQVFHVLRHIIVDIERLSWIRYQPLKLGSFLQVDTFLLLGGLTVSFVTLEIISKEKRFDYFAFIIFRWLRYTPSLLALILLYFLLPQLSSGPIFKQSIRMMTLPCEQYWWRNLLYINNFYDATGNCATHTWYLAVDFQYYALSPLLLFSMKKSPKVGLSLSVLIVLIGSLLPLLPPLLDPSLQPSLYSLNTLLSEEEIQNNFRLLYWSTLQHVSPYFMGVILGFLIHKYDSLPIPSPLEHLLWLLFLTSGIFTIFWTTNWMNAFSATEEPSREWRLLFSATHKITWTILPFWIILVSAFGRPGPIGRFLSSPIWVPLSRLTYCLYLVQLIPIVLRAYSVEHVHTFDDFYNWSIFSFSLVLALLLAFVVFALFESPFSQLIKLLINK